jgi:hypothetical protein
MPIHLTGSLAISGSIDAKLYTQNGQPLSSDPFPFTGSAIVSGSLNVIGNLLQNGVAASPPFPFTGSALTTGSLAVTGSVGFSTTLPGGAASWSAGGALITGRFDLAGAGTQNEALAFGGYTNSGVSTCTEEYNGLSWSTGGALSTARYLLAGAGTQNAGLAFGGSGGYVYPGGTIISACTEEYNGSSWSAGGALITARYALGGVGTQNAGLAFGGVDISNFVGCTEEYNGSSWSSGGVLINLPSNRAGAGEQNAGLAFGGLSIPFAVSCTEEYNGSSWSTGGALITARRSLAGAGTQNAGLAFGGCDNGFAAVSCTEEYNGSSWSAGGALINAMCGLAGAGTQTSALAFGGGGYCTEEYSKGLVTTKTFDYSSTTGRTTVSDLIETSAERYKSNIQPLGPQLSNIMQLQPVEFDWKSNQNHDIGFIADSVQNVYPNLVSTNTQGEIEGMNYTKMVSALVKSIQEQQAQIDELQSKINDYNSN